MTKTIFEKILDQTIPADIVYEDHDTLAFKDISPVAPIHILVIPKKKIISIGDMTEDDIEIVGKILHTAKKVADLMDLKKNGFRIVLNTGNDGGQTVPYLHAHVLGGRRLDWPPG